MDGMEKRRRRRNNAQVRRDRKEQERWLHQFGFTYAEFLEREEKNRLVRRDLIRDLCWIVAVFAALWAGLFLGLGHGR
jgi:hypothetical protein